ncbi:MAG: hypothetical protein GX834_01475 [Clostridiaceae bacterium]|jgi:hypothetical protein|nr:hypothetical protein [Clostridiaceae bacterium]HZW97833.1 hypothetical protein [Bacillota bacterium]
MYWVKRVFLWTAIMVFLIVSVLGCSANNDKPSETTNPTKEESTEDTGSGEDPSGKQEEPAEQTEEVEEPGVSMPFDLEDEPLFNMYTIPTDWPRSVPLMTEFNVMIYEWSDDGMFAAGHGNVSMSRANNFYTNAQKIHVSSNIWEQDPSNPSITEGEEQVFNYIGEGNEMTVFLVEIGTESLFFEIHFQPAN